MMLQEDVRFGSFWLKLTNERQYNLEGQLQHLDADPKKWANQRNTSAKGAKVLLMRDKSGSLGLRTWLSNIDSDNWLLPKTICFWLAGWKLFSCGGKCEHNRKNQTVSFYVFMCLSSVDRRCWWWWYTWGDYSSFFDESLMGMTAITLSLISVIWVFTEPTISSTAAWLFL